MVVTTTPANSLALAQESLRQLLADCPTVQTFLGVTTATDALSHIYHESLPRPQHGETYTPDEQELYRAYILIWTEEEGGYKIARTAFGATDEFDDEGTLMAALTQKVPEGIALDDAEVDIQFRNPIGGIADEMRERSGLPNFLSFSEATFSGPFRTSDNERSELGDEQVYGIEIFWSTLD